MWTIFWTLLLLYAGAENGPSKNSLGGVQSLYTEKLSSLMSRMISEEVRVPVGAQEIWLQCYKTEADPLYIGVRQQLRIGSSLKRLAKVVDDIEAYKDIFPGFSKIKIESKDGSRWSTFWEQIVPIPFVPNVKYRMLYEVGDLKEKYRTYRYQLAEKSSLTYSDGFIILQSIGENETLYTEYDFFNADWGAAKIFGQKRIWIDSIEGLVLSDLAIKFRSINPEWDAKQVKKSAKNATDSKLIKECYSNLMPLDL